MQSPADYLPSVRRGTGMLRSFGALRVRWRSEM